MQHNLPWARLDAARKQELGRNLWDASATGSVAEVVELLDHELPEGRPLFRRDLVPAVQLAGPENGRVVQAPARVHLERGQDLRDVSGVGVLHDRSAAMRPFASGPR